MLFSGAVALFLTIRITSIFKSILVLGMKLLDLKASPFNKENVLKLSMEDLMNHISVFITKSNVKGEIKVFLVKVIVMNILQLAVMSVSDLIYHGAATTLYQPTMTIIQWFTLALTSIYLAFNMLGFFQEA